MRKYSVFQDQYLQWSTCTPATIGEVWAKSQGNNPTHWNTETETQGGISEPSPPSYKKRTLMNRTFLKCLFLPHFPEGNGDRCSNHDLSRYQNILKGFLNHQEKLRLGEVIEQHKHPSPRSNNPKWINALPSSPKQQGWPRVQVPLFSSFKISQTSVWFSIPVFCYMEPWAVWGTQWVPSQNDFLSESNTTCRITKATVLKHACGIAHV